MAVVIEDETLKIRPTIVIRSECISETTPTKNPRTTIAQQRIIDNEMRCFKTNHDSVTVNGRIRDRATW